MIYLELFLSFAKIGLFAFGGGYAALPLIESEIVAARSWLTMDEFVNLITIAEMTPGPIIINSATFAGIRIAGLFGAVCATFGSIFPSCIIVSLLSYIYRRWKNISSFQNILQCLRPVVVALIFSAGLSILKLASFSAGPDGKTVPDYAGIALFAVSFLFLTFSKKKINPVLIMVLCGIVYCVIKSAV